MRLLVLSLLLLSAAACAGSTFNSGVGDALLEQPPYYAGRIVSDTARIGHLPVAYQRGATQAAMFDPRGTPVARLVAEMNEFLDSLGITARISPSSSTSGTPPDVRFSCETDPMEDCATGAGALGRDDIVMRLAVGRPSDEWVTWARPLFEAAGVASALVITLEVGQYRTRQRGLRGDKAVQLGTGHSVPLPWLTSLETPVSVLQITGALMGADGRAIRIGAEGILARRTRLGVSALGAQELLSDEDVEAVRTLRRDDLPGRPLAWQEAMRNLVGELTGGRRR